MKILSEKMIKLISILNDGFYHNGETLCNEFGLTRASIYKTTKKLINYGIKIDSTKGKGYRLIEPLILLDKNKITNLLPKKLRKNYEIMVFESIPSTNEYLAKKNNGNDSKSITIAIAEQQTKGKGRLGRQWHSPFGQNIYISYSYKIKKDISKIAGLSLIIGLATFKTISEFKINKGLFVKWPNDIVHDGKKISGNMVEISEESNSLCKAIIGIGLNVNMMNSSNKINQPWTSMRQITHNYFDRNQIVARLILNIVNDLAIFERDGLNPFLKQWKQYDYLINKKVIIENNKQKIKGKSSGINKFGHLRLIMSDGKIQTFSSGDTSMEASQIANNLLGSMKN